MPSVIMSPVDAIFTLHRLAGAALCADDDLYAALGVTCTSEMYQMGQERPDEFVSKLTDYMRQDRSREPDYEEDDTVRTVRAWCTIVHMHVWDDKDSTPEQKATSREYYAGWLKHELERVEKAEKAEKAEKNKPEEKQEDEAPCKKAKIA